MHAALARAGGRGGQAATTTSSSTRAWPLIRGPGVGGRRRRGRGGRGCRGSAGAGAAGAAAGAAAPAASVSNTASSLPTATRSPGSPASARMRPLTGAGTSTVAFWVSTSTSGWSSGTSPRAHPPGHDFRIDGAFAQVRQLEHVAAHAPSMTRETPRRRGLAREILPLEGMRIGRVPPVTRSMGACRFQKQPSWIVADELAPNPPKRVASCTITQRPVR